MRSNRGNTLREHEEQARLYYYNQGLTDAEIGRRLYIGVQGIYLWRKSRGLPAHKRRNTSVSADMAKLREQMYKAGKSDPEIAEATGMTRSGVQGWRRRNGLKSNEVVLI